MSTKLFTISEHASLKEALKKIESNHLGIVIGVDDNNVVIGVATDGDIRRKILNGASLDETVSSFLTREFVWANSATPREKILKLLDNRIKVIPLLNEAGHLVDVISNDRLPLQLETQIYARARSPVRISFGGGGSDLTHFFVDNDGAVINTTIGLYSHAALRVRKDSRVHVYSKDLDESLEAANLDELLKVEGKFGLIQSLLKAICPDFGFDLFLHSDFPMKSGLGGSAVVSSAILGCFNQFRQDRWSLYEIAELAFQAERLHLGVAGGWQDQYATVFGGFNFMEFQMDQNLVHPLRINSDVLLELEESLLLCDTHTIHDSGMIHTDQREQMSQSDIQAKVGKSRDITYKMRSHLLRGKLQNFGEMLDEAWQLKRHFSQKISTEYLDSIYDLALKNGAIGGKLLGAGGGGYFLFYVTPFCKNNLITVLEKEGLSITPFRFEQNGLQSWTVRED